ncbi:MAG: S8 family serine peptidase [Pontiellaceae bacterium]|nr:S8 family serine peptidase [Pontiellaceae bacterium]
MKRVWAMGLLSIGLTIGSAKAQEMVTPETAMAETAALWTGMHEAGMIDDEQYAYALTNGGLPGGTVVENSAIPKEKQNGWQRMAEHRVISDEELAHVYFQGKMPNMTAAEQQAFAELALVYQPDRKKRNGYEIRRKHQRVELIRMKYREQERWETRRAEAVKKANAAGLPIRMEENGNISELVAWENGQPLYLTTHNRISAQTISTDTVRPGGSEPFALNGSGVTIGLWDGGIAVSNHVEFTNGRVWAGMDQGTNAPSVHQHATGMAGTMVAAGIDPDARGMAYAAQVESYDWNFDIAEMAACVASNKNIQISNHSYGMLCGWELDRLIYNPSNGHWLQIWRGDTRLSVDEDYHFGLYDTNSWTLDNFCFSASRHLPVYSAGNDRGNYNTGPYAPNHIYWNYIAQAWYESSYNRSADGLPAGYDCITPYGVAKNILTVGAVQDLPGGYTNGATVVLESYSGTGPTDDGRIKPDVVANGQELYTTYGTTTTSYDEESGTSLAAPSVAGSLALVQELYEHTHGRDEPLLASTLKGIAIHTAHDIGPVGPDYTFGWGLFSTPVASWAVSNNMTWDSLPYIKEVALADGDYVEFNVAANTTEPLKVTIVWTDPAGPIQPVALDPTNRVLINDLDLRVIDPNGTTHYPWVLDGANPSAAATTGDNVLDNVEQVVIENTTAGLYTIMVTHKGTLANGVQDVSILLSGNVAVDAPSLQIDAIDNAPEPQIEWSGIVGGLYQIEASEDLTDTNSWAEAGIISASRELLDWTDEESTNQSTRFYRIQRER